MKESISISNFKVKVYIWRGGTEKGENRNAKHDDFCEHLER